MAIAQGRAIPSDILNAPDLTLGLEVFYEGFYALTSCRGVGFGEGPIPRSAIADYCKELELDEEQKFAMLHHVRMMDITYLKFQANKAGRS